MCGCHGSLHNSWKHRPKGSDFEPGISLLSNNCQYDIDECLLTKLFIQDLHKGSKTVCGAGSVAAH